MKHVSPLLVLACALVAGTAVAGDPPPAPMDHGAMHGAMGHGHADQAPPADAFTRLDTNHDGRLSQAELAGHPMAAHAGMVDADQDGTLDRSEFAQLEAM